MGVVLLNPQSRSLKFPSLIPEFPVRPTFSQRFRNLFESGSRRMDFSHPGVRALLVLLALGTVAALAAASWLAYLDSRNAAVAVTDPRVIYVNNIRQKIQAAMEAALTTLGKPDQQGSPQLRIQVNYRGELTSATVVRSSGHPPLDELAVRIVKQAAPFEPFSLEMRRTTNIVEITSDFNFH